MKDSIRISTHGNGVIIEDEHNIFLVKQGLDTTTSRVASNRAELAGSYPVSLDANLLLNSFLTELLITCTDITSYKELTAQAATTVLTLINNNLKRITSPTLVCGIQISFLNGASSGMGISSPISLKLTNGITLFFDSPAIFEGSSLKGFTLKLIGSKIKIDQPIIGILNTLTADTIYYYFSCVKMFTSSDYLPPILNALGFNCKEDAFDIYPLGDVFTSQSVMIEMVADAVMIRKMTSTEAAMSGIDNIITYNGVAYGIGCYISDVPMQLKKMVERVRSTFSKMEIEGDAVSLTAEQHQWLDTTIGEAEDKIKEYTGKVAKDLVRETAYFNDHVLIASKYPVDQIVHILTSIRSFGNLPLEIDNFRKVLDLLEDAFLPLRVQDSFTDVNASMKWMLSNIFTDAINRNNILFDLFRSSDISRANGNIKAVLTDLELIVYDSKSEVIPLYDYAGLISDDITYPLIDSGLEISMTSTDISFDPFSAESCPKAQYDQLFNLTESVFLSSIEILDDIPIPIVIENELSFRFQAALNGVRIGCVDVVVDLHQVLGSLAQCVMITAINNRSAYRLTTYKEWHSSSHRHLGFQADITVASLFEIARGLKSSFSVQLSVVYYNLQLRLGHSIGVAQNQPIVFEESVGVAIPTYLYYGYYAGHWFVSGNPVVTPKVTPRLLGPPPSVVDGFTIRDIVMRSHIVTIGGKTVTFDKLANSEYPLKQLVASNEDLLLDTGSWNAFLLELSTKSGSTKPWHDKNTLSPEAIRALWTIYGSESLAYANASIVQQMYKIMGQESTTMSGALMCLGMISANHSSNSNTFYKKLNIPKEIYQYEQF